MDDQLVTAQKANAVIHDSVMLGQVVTAVVVGGPGVDVAVEPDGGDGDGEEVPTGEVQVQICEEGEGWGPGVLPCDQSPALEPADFSDASRLSYSTLTAIASRATFRGPPAAEIMPLLPKLSRPRRTLGLEPLFLVTNLVANSRKVLIYRGPLNVALSDSTGYR